MTQHHIHNRTGLPQDMRILLQDYPREAWPNHPNFAESIRNWMGAHQMFRKLGGILKGSTEAILDKNMDNESYAQRLGYYGNLLVRNLHGHHGWEDHRFFPELQDADARFTHGLDMLESDHEEMDHILDGLTQSANQYLKLMDLSEKDAEQELPALLGHTGNIAKFLDRHLTDEEDLVVPILLHHKLRG